MPPRWKQGAEEEGKGLLRLGESGEKGDDRCGLSPYQSADQSVLVAPVNNASHAILPCPEHQRERLGQEVAQRTLDDDFSAADFPDRNGYLLDMAAAARRIDRDTQEVAGKPAARDQKRRSHMGGDLAAAAQRISGHLKTLTLEKSKTIKS